MSTTSNKFHCLICASTSSTISKVDKADVLFLLRILLQIPQDSHLIYTIKSSLNIVKICDQCTSSVKQCRQLYTEIGQRIEKFWGVQNLILGKISSSIKNPKKNDDYSAIICEVEDDDDQTNYNNWMNQCRKYVKDHHFGGFGYPFIVQDLTALLATLPPPPPTQSPTLTKHLTVNLTRVVKKETPVNLEEDNEHSVNYDDNFSEGGSPEHVASPTPSPEKLGDTSTTTGHQNVEDEVRVKEEAEPEVDNDDLGDDVNYSSENSEDDDDDSASGGSDDEYQPPSKKTRSSVSKQGNQEEKPTIKNYPTKIQKWSKYKKDPETGKFICEWPECDKQFACSAAFRAHVDKHKGTPTHKCNKCDEKFYRRTHLHLHKEEVHGNKEFKCEICGKIYLNSKRLKGHLSDVHIGRGETICCEICGKSMKKRYLNLHMRRSHLNSMTKYYCHLCPVNYENVMELKIHLLRVHEYCEKEEEREEILGRIEKRKEAAKLIFKCHVKRCKVTYRSREALVRHVEGKHGGKWDVEEDEAGVDFKCEICGRGYHEKRRFNEHRRQHENLEKERFKCGECGRCFGSRFSWKMHEETHLEERDKKWRCEVCGRGFVEEKVLRKHLESRLHKKNVEEMEGE